MQTPVQPLSNLDRPLPLPMEAFVVPEQIQADQTQVLLSSHHGSGMRLALEESHWAFRYHGNKERQRVAADTRPAVRGQRVHVAAVFHHPDKLEAALYVDGQLRGQTQSQDYKLTNLPISIGAKTDFKLQPGEFFHGVVEQVRISHAVRYGSDFTPPAEFAADDRTVLLYRFDEGAGKVLHDASGNGLDAQIHGAQWTGLIVPTSGRTVE